MQFKYWHLQQVNSVSSILSLIYGGQAVADCKKSDWKTWRFYQLGVTKIICLWLHQFCQKHDLRIEVAHANESIIWIFYKVCLLHWSSLNREYIITLRSTKRGPLNISSVQAKIGLSQTHKVIGKLENCASILFLFENAPILPKTQLKNRRFPSWWVHDLDFYKLMQVYIII